MKRYQLTFVILFCLLSTIFCNVFSQDEIIHIEDVYINPTYKDLISEEELQSKHSIQQKLFALEGTEPVVITTTEQISQYLKTSLKNYESYL